MCKDVCTVCGITLTPENRCHLFVVNRCCWKCSGKKKEPSCTLILGKDGDVEIIALKTVR